MGEYRRRTPKKPEHPVREWISDNLRYFMLIGGILAIILIALLIVKLISGGFGGQSPVKAETKSESTQQIVPSEKDPETIEHETEVTPTPAEVVVPEKEDETKEDETEEFTKEVDNSMITNLIRNFFEGLAAKDPAQVENCTDALSDEDKQMILSDPHTSYTDVEVITCDGTDEKSRIAFVSYYYTVDGSDVKIPGLTEFYIYDTGNGRWKLASDISTVQGVQERVNELKNDENVAEMVSKVQHEYDQVLSEHPELQ